MSLKPKSSKKAAIGPMASSPWKSKDKKNEFSELPNEEIKETTKRSSEKSSSKKKDSKNKNKDK